MFFFSSRSSGSQLAKRLASRCWYSKRLRTENLPVSWEVCLLTGSAEKQKIRWENSEWKSNFKSNRFSWMWSENLKISNIETAFSSIWLASWKDLDDVLALMKGLSKKSVIPLISKKRVRTVIYFFRQKFLVLTDWWYIINRQKYDPLLRK